MINIELDKFTWEKELQMLNCIFETIKLCANKWAQTRLKIKLPTNYSLIKLYVLTEYGIK